MIITLESDSSDEVLQTVLQVAASYPDVEAKPMTYTGRLNTVIEILLLGDTKAVPMHAFEGIEGVSRVIRVQRKYKLIGRHSKFCDQAGFEYNGVRFDESKVHVFAGLCAVDSEESVEAMFRACQENGLVTSRMGAYKPRTSPYDFQGLGRECLGYVFRLAGQYGIKVIAMEIVNASQVQEIEEELEAAGNPTGVMLQIGTRNAQNFELLKAVGQQSRFPVLYKRGMGISLEESLNGCEYLAAHGNANIVFCLRGVKTHLGAPHRNLVDFMHIPVIRRQTRLSVCVDPSHSVGTSAIAPDGVPDVFVATGQGVIAGASMVLVDFHPFPERALCDGPQALRLPQLPALLSYVRSVRGAYEACVQIGSGLPVTSQPSSPTSRAATTSAGNQKNSGATRGTKRGADETEGATRGSSSSRSPKKKASSGGGEK